MKITKIPQIEVIQSEDPIEFKKQFNDLMKTMTEVGDIDIKLYSDTTYRAIISYTIIAREFDSVADEFHAEGLRYLCRNCPHLEDPEDKRIKHCKCKYAELGRTHKDHEACELFYRELKTGRIEPIEDYMR